MAALRLPDGFESLIPFVDTWALPTENQRSQVRWNAAPEQFQAFYDAFLPHLDEALGYLDKFKLGELPPETETLFHLTLAFAEVAPHVELYNGSNQVPLSFDNSLFTAAHGDQVQR